MRQLVHELHGVNFFFFLLVKSMGGWPTCRLNIVSAGPALILVYFYVKKKNITHDTRQMHAWHRTTSSRHHAPNIMDDIIPPAQGRQELWRAVQFLFFLSLSSVFSLFHCIGVAGVCVCIQCVCVRVFTLNRSLYSSTSSTPSVRADSSS